MPSFMNYASIIAVLAVGVVLVFGLGTMLSGKSANASQRFMRWRVVMQFIAIIVLMTTVYLVRR